MIKGIIQACCLLGLISMVSSCSSEVIFDQAKREDVISQHCISIEESRSDLIKILYDIAGDSTRAPEFVSRKICDEYTVNKRIETRTGDFDTLALHVFNFKDNMGYALMSGDNRIPSLLVLTEEGNLANNEVNSIEGGVSVFYERLENNSLFELKPVDPVFNGNIAYDEYNTYGSWENVIHTVNNCNVKWGQGNPYNKIIKLL
ncbi:MAG: hypothetical protein HDS97_07655 [Bacteroidales bacterium]|nr:hypothetical protein [Bacteroidales bacterium]